MTWLSLGLSGAQLSSACGACPSRVCCSAWAGDGAGLQHLATCRRCCAWTCIWAVGVQLLGWGGVRATAFRQGQHLQKLPCMCGSCFAVPPAGQTTAPYTTAIAATHAMTSVRRAAIFVASCVCLLLGTRSTALTTLNELSLGCCDCCSLISALHCLLSVLAYEHQAHSSDSSKATMSSDVDDCLFCCAVSAEGPTQWSLML